MEATKVNEYGLTPKEEAFCQLYTSDMKRNATKAAIGAGYSPKTAGVIASQNLKKLKISNRIKDLYIEAMENTGYSAEEVRLLVMRKLTSMVMADLPDIIKVVYADEEKRQFALDQLADANDGQRLLDFGEPVTYIKPTSEWSPGERAAVKSIQFSHKEGIKIELSDKLSAMRLLSDITGLTKQSVEISGSGGQPLALNLIFQEGGTEENDDEPAGYQDAVSTPQCLEDGDT